MPTAFLLRHHFFGRILAFIPSLTDPFDLGEATACLYFILSQVFLSLTFCNSPR